MKKIITSTFLVLFGLSLTLAINSENNTISYTQDCHEYAQNAANMETSFWEKLFYNGAWEANYAYWYGVCEDNNGETGLLDPVQLN